MKRISLGIDADTDADIYADGVAVGKDMKNKENLNILTRCCKDTIRIMLGFKKESPCIIGIKMMLI